MILTAHKNLVAASLVEHLEHNTLETWQAVVHAVTRLSDWMGGGSGRLVETQPGSETWANDDLLQFLRELSQGMETVTA